MHLRETAKSLWPYLKDYKRNLILGISALLFTDICVLVTPILQQRAVDGIIGRDPLKIIFVFSFGIFFMIALAGIGRYFWRMLYATTSIRIAYDLRKDLFADLMSFSTKFYTKYTTGDLMARATNDLEAVRMMLGPGTLVSIDAMVLGVPSLCMLFWINWKMALLALIPLPFIALIVAYFEKLIHMFFEKVQEQFSSMSEKVRENVSGVRVVKAYTQEREEVENFRKLSGEYASRNIKLINVESMFHPAIMFFAHISLIIILVVGAMLVIREVLTVGFIMAFYEYMWLMVWPMIAVGWVVSLLQRGTASMKRLNRIFEARPEIRDPDNPVEPGEIEGTIEFENVWFKFEEDSEWALKDVSFKMEGGGKFAIVGRVGSGKSALVALLLRFYDPQKGRILLDGVDIRRLRVRDLRSAFGFVPQETFLFSDTIKENIAFGMKEYDDENIYRVTEIAQLSDNIQEFPREFDTLVGERGVTLSGGQKQRTAISRALIVDPPIIVMDDAFSSLDTETEDRILKNLDGEWRNRTTIVISHRISTIKDFDRTIVLDDGEVAEMGTHEELLDLDGIYRRIYEQQKLREALA